MGKVGFFLAFSKLSIMGMEWRTFLEYDWGLSLLNTFVGIVLCPQPSGWDFAYSLRKFVLLLRLLTFVVETRSSALSS